MLAIQDGERSRARAMAIFARENDCSWASVRCLRGYYRLFTRQESWDEGASDVFDGEAVDKRADANGLEYVLGKGWVSLSGGPVPTQPDKLEEPPEDWEPGDGDPVWGFCSRSEPDSRRCWILEGPEG